MEDERKGSPNEGYEDFDTGREKESKVTIDPIEQGSNETRYEEVESRCSRKATLLKVAAVVGFIAITILFITVFKSCYNNKAEEITTATTTEATITGTTTFTPPIGSWEEVEIASGPDNNIVENGSPELAAAKTEEEVRAAINLIIEEIKTDRHTLALYANAIYDRLGILKIVNPDELFTNGWANNTAISLVREIKSVLSKSTMSKDYAPNNWYNSHVDESGVGHSAAKPGVDQGQKMGIIELPNSEKFGIDPDCVNPLTPEKIPDKPVVPTTKPATSTATTKAPTTTSTIVTTTVVTTAVDSTTVPSTTVPSTTKPATTLEKKDPSKDPYIKGNAGDGGGTNRNTGTQPSTTPLTTKVHYTWTQNTQGTTWVIPATTAATTAATTKVEPGTVATTSAATTTTKKAVIETSEVSNGTTVVNTGVVTYPGFSW